MTDTGAQPPEGYWLASDGRYYPPEQHPDARPPAPPPPPPPPPTFAAPPPSAPAVAQPAGGAAASSGPLDPEPPAARWWVLGGGLWMTLCWIGVVACFATGNPGPALLFIVLMVPINLLWRFVYWRRRRTPEYNIVRRAPTAGFTTDHVMVGLTYGGSTLDDQGMAQMNADYAAADARQAAGANLTGKVLQRGVNRGCGSMVAGFIFPMRDGWREMRYANGKGKPPAI